MFGWPVFPLPLLPVTCAHFALSGGKHEVQCLVKVVAEVFSSTASLSIVRGVCGACRSRWMRMAGWPDPTLGKTSQWWDRTWICVVPEKCWSRVEMFCSYWSFVKLAWPMVFSLKKRKLKTGLQRWLRGDALVLEVWRPELRSPAPSKSQARRHALVILLLEERQRKLDGI